MSFGDTLREVSGNTMFEEMVWEKMKPELIHIAGDRHANGCFVRFIGFGKTFTEKIRKIILDDGITDYNYYADDDEWHYGVIYWGEDGYRIKPGISDMYLEVTLSCDKSISMERIQLTDEKKKIGYTYIS